MDLKTYKTISPALNAELTAVFKKHGLELAQINAAVDPLGGTIRYSLKARDLSVDGFANMWTQYHELHGMEKEWLGRTVKAGSDTTFTIAGLRDTRGGKSVVLRRGDGKIFFTTPDSVRGQLQLQDKAA